MQIHNLFTKKTFHIVTWIVAILILLGFVFSAGIHVGIRKASHSFERRGKFAQFEPPCKNKELSPFMERGELGETHGVLGKIISIEGNKLTVRDRNNEDRIVNSDDKTEIKMMNQKTDINTLKIDDLIMVFGETNDSEQINARLIRVLPKMDEFNSVTK